MIPNDFEFAHLGAHLEANTFDEFIISVSLPHSSQHDTQPKNSIKTPLVAMFFVLGEDNPSYSEFARLRETLTFVNYFQ